PGPPAPARRSATPPRWSEGDGAAAVDPPTPAVDGAPARPLLAGSAGQPPVPTGHRARPWALPEPGRLTRHKGPSLPVLGLSRPATHPLRGSLPLTAHDNVAGPLACKALHRRR